MINIKLLILLLLLWQIRVHQIKKSVYHTNKRNITTGKAYYCKLSLTQYKHVVTLS